MISVHEVTTQRSPLSLVSHPAPSIFTSPELLARRERETLADWAVICDDLICSSHVAALKAEDPRAFFGPWLAANGMGFADAVLIDDRVDNCTAKQRAAGFPRGCQPLRG